MGTNYYHNTEPCPHCGHSKEQRHIGKSSAGWTFALHVYPEDSINDLADWERLWAEGIIKDEYGDTVSRERMREIITNRSWPRASEMTETEVRRNFAERGPNNLLRSAVDGRRVLGHGEGTWDLHTGDFS